MQAIRRHRQAWRELHDARLEDNLRSAPQYLEAALANYGSELPFKVLFVYRHEGSRRRLVACAPLARREAGPSELAGTLTWWAGAHDHLSHPLLHRDFAAEAVRAINHRLMHCEGDLNLLRLPQVNLDSETWRLWARCLEEDGIEPLARHEFDRPMLQRHGSLDDYLATLSPRRRKNYRRQWRVLNRAGRVEVMVHRGPGANPDLPRQFMAMEAAGWKGKQNTAMGCSAENAGFFVELVHRFETCGQLFCVELRLDDRPIAMSCSFVVGTTLFGFKVAHDPEFSAFSPGALVAVQEVGAFLRSPKLLMGDSGSSAGSFIRSYWRERTRVARVLVPLSRRGQLALRGLRAALWVKNGATVPTTHTGRSKRAS